MRQHSRPSRRRRTRFALPRPRVRVRMVLLTVFGFILSGGIGAGTYFWPAITTALNITGHHDLVTATPGAPSLGATAAATIDAPPPPNSPFTVLLLGSDDDAKFQAGQVLTQSMILMRVDPSTNQVTMFSIPRDLYVPLSTGGSDKIDTAYLNGGAHAAIDTVQRDFQVHVDHYVWIGLKGLVHLIDEVGGVDIVTSHPVLDDYYPADLTSNNAYDYSRVAVLAGAQHLDGLHAMEYVRSRHDDLYSDLGRSQRQQQVLVALRAKAQLMSVGDVPRFFEALQGEFTTDMSVTDLPPLLGLAKRITPEQTKHVFLGAGQIHDQMVGSESVLIPTWDAILPVVHQSFPPA